MTIRFGSAASPSTYGTPASNSLARAGLGMGSMSVQNSTAVSITGGAIASSNVDLSAGKINGVVIGATNASSASFTGVSLSSNLSAVHLGLSSGMNATTGTFTGSITASSGSFNTVRTGVKATFISTVADDTVVITNTHASNGYGVYMTLSMTGNGVTNYFYRGDDAGGNKFNIYSDGSYTGKSLAVTSGVSASSGTFTGGITASSIGSTNVALSGGMISGVNLPYVAKTTSYTIQSSDYIVDCTSGALTITLPSATGHNRSHVIKDASTGEITVTTTGQLIDGATQFKMSVQYESITVYSDGSNWKII